MSYNTDMQDLCSLIMALVKISRTRLAYLTVSLFLVLVTMASTSQSIETECSAHLKFYFALFIIH
jgi:hypothetical protein